MADEDEMDDSPEAEKGAGGPLTTADFHTIAQKQIMNAVFAVLAEAKMDWALVEPFLESARELVLGDFEETGRVRLHVMRAEGESWVEAEEAFLGISVSDRDSGEEWLAETYWLSEIALADEDHVEIRKIAAGLRRSLAKIDAWLEDKPGDAAEATPPEEKPEA